MRTKSTRPASSSRGGSAGEVLVPSADEARVFTVKARHPDDVRLRATQRIRIEMMKAARKGGMKGATAWCQRFAALGGLAQLDAVPEVH